MWEGSYGKEPFDLRLTVLRLIRNLNKILVLTVVGTLLFGGGYYVKNVLLRSAKEYTVTSTYKVEYVNTPTQTGDYYINEATWNSLLQTEEFLTGVQAHLQEAADDNGISVPKLSLEELSAVISAKLPSDWHVPTTTVVTKDAGKTLVVAQAVELAMANEFVDMMRQEVAGVAVLDGARQAEEVPLDVRPARAFILSAILSFLFVTVVFLLKETGDDSIWLPATLRQRYGLPVLGTINSVELAEHVRYLFAEKDKIAVCVIDDKVSPVAVREELAVAVAKTESGAEEDLSEAIRKWIPMPTPLMCPEAYGTLREMDGILLVVKAGAHAGKSLEYVLEQMSLQDCKITGVILWEADELLLKAYYCLPESDAA